MKQLTINRARTLGKEQSPERLTGPSESEPVSSEDWIPAGSAPPFIQSGMIVRHKDGGPR